MVSLINANEFICATIALFVPYCMKYAKSSGFFGYIFKTTLFITFKNTHIRVFLRKTEEILKKKLFISSEIIAKGAMILKHTLIFTKIISQV